MKKAPEPFETIQQPDSDQRKPPERSGLFRQNEAQLADRRVRRAGTTTNHRKENLLLGTSLH